MERKWNYTCSYMVFIFTHYESGFVMARSESEARNLAMRDAQAKCGGYWVREVSVSPATIVIG